MDYFNSNGNGETLSLQDMIECDIRSNFHEGNMEISGDLLSTNSNLEPQLSVTVGEIGSMFDGPFSSLEGLICIPKSEPSSLDLAPGSGSGLGEEMSWLQSVNIAAVQEMCKNTNPNLMVNPQTGIPNSEESVLTKNGGVGAVLREDALIRSPSTPKPHLQSNNTTTFVKIQEQPLFIGLKQEESPQPSTPTTMNTTTTTTELQLSTGATLHIKQHEQSTTLSNNTSSTIRQQLQGGQLLHCHSPSSPSPVYTTNISSPNTHSIITSTNSQKHPSPIKPSKNKSDRPATPEKVFPKPVYSYSCLIAMALKNCETGCLPVSEIYNFMTENFPYFKTAPDGWKNSVRHNLSLNKCFEKIENPKSTGTTKKGCLWAMNPAKIEKMEEEIAKWRKKDPAAIMRSMAKPEVLDLLEQGHGGRSPRTTIPVTAAAFEPPTSNVITKVTASGPIPPLAKETQNNHESKAVTNISANVNFIEIKPLKVEQTGGSSGATKDDLVNFTNDELSVLDNNLDPALNDLAIQNGLFAVGGMFDDFDSNDLLLDDLARCGSPLSFTVSSTGGLTASPIHFNAGASGAVPSADEKTSLHPGFNIFSCSAATPTSTQSKPSTNYTISRTISAQT